MIIKGLIRSRNSTGFIGLVGSLNFIPRDESECTRSIKGLSNMMNWEYHRETIPTDVQDQILRTHFKFRDLKSKYRIGAADAVQREALVREYLVLSELTTAGEIPYSFSSKRRYLGPISVRLKKMLIKLINPIIRQAFQRQTALNEHLISRYQAMHELELRIQALERDVSRLSHLEARR